MKLKHKYLLLLLLCIIPSPNVHAGDAVTPKEYNSVEERRLDNSILQERVSIRREREDISMRKKELKTLEEAVDKKLTDIDSKLEELRKLQDQITNLLVSKSEKEQIKRNELANIYQRMLPEKAALAISGLDKQLAADLLANMKAKAAAKILNQISKQKATELSTTFSTLKLE
jgi:flagellar motility protein MotE (MotC chaperone)